MAESDEPERAGSSQHPARRRATWLFNQSDRAAGVWVAPLEADRATGTAHRDRRWRALNPYRCGMAKPLSRPRSSRAANAVALVYRCPWPERLARVPRTFTATRNRRRQALPGAQGAASRPAQGSDLDAQRRSPGSGRHRFSDAVMMTQPLRIRRQAGAFQQRRFAVPSIAAPPSFCAPAQRKAPVSPAPATVVPAPACRAPTRRGSSQRPCRDRNKQLLRAPAARPHDPPRRGPAHLHAGKPPDPERVGNDPQRQRSWQRAGLSTYREVVPTGQNPRRATAQRLTLHNLSRQCSQ